VNTLLIETALSSGPTLQLVEGDITAETTEAIVNSANETLKHGAGVAGAIAQRGGPDIQAESDAWVRKHGPVSHAEPAWTSGGRLPCPVLEPGLPRRYVIHAVGPVWGDTQGADAPFGDCTGEIEDSKLGAAVTGSLHLADELGLLSISLPAISTGIFGFPKERAAGIIIKAIQSYFEMKPNSGIKNHPVGLLRRIHGPVLEPGLPRNNLPISLA
jgi:O-acetyl-ADP-ribose deacetylase (regulator of RNase III)